MTTVTKPKHQRSRRWSASRVYATTTICLCAVSMFAAGWTIVSHLVAQ
jgi:hypothetical protein